MTASSDSEADVVRARPRQLDDSFDNLIAAIPEGLVQAADDFVLDPEFSRDPYTPLLALRDRDGFVVEGHGGIYGDVTLPNLFGHDREKPHFIIMGIEELERVSMSPKAFVNSGAYGSHVDTLGRIPTLTDGAEHTALRGAYNEVLNHRAMQTRAETLIGPINEFLLDRLEGKFRRGETVDIPRDLALPLTYKAMSTMIGVPQDRFAEFVKLGETLFTAPLQPDKGVKASADLLEFYRAEAEKRKVDPQPDMLSWLLQAEAGGRRFTDVEAAEHARFLLPAGVETTWRQLALMFVALLGSPEQYRLVVEDPDLVSPAVEEVFRFLPSGFVIPRLAEQDFTVGGVEIPAGSSLIMLEGIANRDPRRWEDPNCFDVRRPFRQHRNFNIGVHACAGQHLARLELETVLRETVRRFPDLKLACSPADIEVRGLQVRTPMRVPVKLS
jgi:cytochrome P450